MNYPDSYIIDRMWPLMGALPEVARDAAYAKYVEETERAKQRKKVDRMIEAVRPQQGESKTLRYIDDLMRMFGNRAGFGVPDQLEAGANSLIYDVPWDASLAVSRARSRAARKRVAHEGENVPFDPTAGAWWGKNVVGPTVDTLGTLAGYAAALPSMPTKLVAGALSPAVPFMEGTRGYLDADGSIENRLRGAGRAVFNPLSWVNPYTPAGVGALMGAEPAMDAAGLGDYTPQAFADRLVGY